MIVYQQTKFGLQEREKKKKRKKEKKKEKKRRKKEEEEEVWNAPSIQKIYIALVQTIPTSEAWVWYEYRPFPTGTSFNSGECTVISLDEH